MAVMLSFNELAWIVVGGVVVVFLFFWNQYLKFVVEHPVKLTTQEYIGLTNRPVLGPDEIVVPRNRDTGYVRLTATEYNSLTNRTFLRGNEIAVDAAWYARMGQAEKESVSVSLQEYADLKKRIVLKKGERIVMAEALQELVENESRGSAENKELRRKMEEAERALDSERHANTRAIDELQNAAQLRKELLGLKGNMTNVVFVIDISGSMNDGNRWPDAKKTIKNWIQYLPIQNCAVLCFNHLSYAYPNGDDPKLVDVRDTVEGRASRKRIADFLDDQKPSGQTDTPMALAKAYALTNADTIILFTDGRPASKEERIFDKALAEKTYTLIQSEQAGRKRPLNVVGIGDYFDKKFGEYLKTISTNGTFIGR